MSHRITICSIECIIASLLVMIVTHMLLHLVDMFRRSLSIIGRQKCMRIQGTPHRGITYPVLTLERT
jgi:hypothetical protein